MKYLITGATGLIGSALVKKLASESAIMVCPVRSIEKARSLFNPMIFNTVQWIETSLEEYLKNLSDNFDFIIHCASPTASKYFVDCPVETLQFNINTTTALLDFACKYVVKGLVFLSSLESYGTVLDDKSAIDEDFQGYVNPMEARSSYNMAKRVCECLCHAYAVEFGVPVKVVRLTQTISPFIAHDDMRVFAQFARQAANGEDIVLHTEGNSSRQYIHVDDAVEAILYVLQKGAPGEAYNAAREDSYISVRNMAEFVQHNFNPQRTVKLQLRDDMGYAPTTKIRLDMHKIRNLGWVAKKGLYEMYRDLILQLKR